MNTPRTSAGPAAGAPTPSGPGQVRGFVVPLDRVTIPVAVDSNEAQCGLAARLRGLGVPVEVRPLHPGDVAIGDRIRIERKTVSDLLASLADGRLFRQGYALRDRERPLLLIEGDPYELVQDDDAAQVRGALLTFLIGYRVPVAQTGSLEETAACVVHLALQEQRRLRRRERRRSDPGLPHDALRLLEALPDIGPARARALVERVGSLRAIVAADIDTLTRVPGIGRITAARLVEALGHTAPARADAGRR